MNTPKQQDKQEQQRPDEARHQSDCGCGPKDKQPQHQQQQQQRHDQGQPGREDKKQAPRRGEEPRTNNETNDEDAGIEQGDRASGRSR